MKKIVFALLSLLIIAGAGFDGVMEPASAVKTLPEENDAVYVEQMSTVQPDEELPVVDQIVFTPTVEEIKENGYPVNDAGETYGPDVKDREEEPDLILVDTGDGVVGYIKKADINNGASSLEEAREWEPNSYVVPIYLEDGCTQIGEFEIGAE